MLSTALVIWAIAAAVRSRLIDCSSVRSASIALLSEISREPLAIASLPWRTRDTIWIRLSCMVLSAFSIAPASSLPLPTISPVRSPLATWSAMRTASASGLVIERVATQDSQMPSSKALSAVTPMTPLTVRMLPLEAWNSSSACLILSSISWSSGACACGASGVMKRM